MMDTHAIGAALLPALGGSQVPVAHSLATEPKNGKNRRIGSSPEIRSAPAWAGLTAYGLMPIANLPKS